MPSKIIFLDIDGVLNCDTSKSRCGRYIGIDRDKTQRLARIVKETNAAIVLTSTWKEGWKPMRQYDAEEYPHAKYLDKHLYKKGDGLYCIDKTREKWPNARGMGIKAWLAVHPEVTDWIVLDDIYFPDFARFDIDGHLILTSPKDGLTEECVQVAIDMLQGKRTKIFYTHDEKWDIIKE